MAKAKEVLMGSRIRKRKLCRVLCGVLCASVVTLCLGEGAGYAFADATRESYEEQIASLQAEQDRLLGEIENLQNEASQSEAYKNNLDQLATATQTKIWLSETMLTQLDNQIKMAEADIAAAEAAMSDTMDRYLARVRENYESGGASYLELILGAESFSDFLARMERLNAILEYDNDLMARYEEQMASLEQKKSELEASRETEKAAMETLEADKANFEKLAEQTQAYIDSLESDAQAAAERYAEVAREEANLNAELEAFIQEQQKRSQAVFTPSAGFIRPISNGTGYISCTFGSPDPAGVAHRGTDIACGTGTPIMAAASGTVLRASPFSTYGNCIIIDHGGNISTLYAHCSAILVSVGQTVNQGDVIGLVGTTGFVTGPHLHFEYRVAGQIVNPQIYVPM